MTQSACFLSLLHEKCALSRTVILFSYFVLFATFLPGQTFTPKSSAVVSDQKYVKDKILVRFRPMTTAAAMQRAHSGIGSMVLGDSQLVVRLQLVQLAPSMSVHEAI